MLGLLIFIAIVLLIGLYVLVGIQQQLFELHSHYHGPTGLRLTSDDLPGLRKSPEGFFDPSIMTRTAKDGVVTYTSKGASDD